MTLLLRGRGSEYQQLEAKFGKSFVQRSLPGMRTLVVNAYSSEKGTKRFQEFVAILRPILMHYDKSAKMVIRKYNEATLNPLKPSLRPADADRNLTRDPIGL